jgi:hypothetical protein
MRVALNRSLNGLSVLLARNMTSASFVCFIKTAASDIAYRKMGYRWKSSA